MERSMKILNFVKYRKKINPEINTRVERSHQRVYRKQTKNYVRTSLPGVQERENPCLELFSDLNRDGRSGEQVVRWDSKTPPFEGPLFAVTVLLRGLLSPSEWTFLFYPRYRFSSFHSLWTFSLEVGQHAKSYARSFRYAYASLFFRDLWFSSPVVCGYIGREDI